MEKYSRKSLRNIQMIVQDKTGADITANRKMTGHKTKQTALLAGCLLCFVTLCTFAYAYADETAIERQRNMKTIELQRALRDYDKDNIVDVSVHVGASDNEIIAVNVFLVIKDEITDADEQELKAIAAEIIDIDSENIYIQCVDIETFAPERTAEELAIKRQRYMKEIEVTQALCDYDKDNIVKAYVHAGTSDNEIISLNVFLVVKDVITEADKQELKAIAAEILDIDAENVYIEYIDSETFM